MYSHVVGKVTDFFHPAQDQRLLCFFDSWSLIHIGKDYTMTRRAKTLIIIALMLGMSLTALDSTITGTALPSIIGKLGGFELYSWIFSVYLLTSTTTIPIYGKLADLYG